MKLKEFLKEYYDVNEEVNMKSQVIDYSYRDMILPGTFGNLRDYRKTLAWNMDRDVFYREATKEDGGSTLYVTLTTGKIDFYTTFDGDKEFLELLKKGLKKHRSYRKEFLGWSPGCQYLYFSKKYE